MYFNNEQPQNQYYDSYMTRQNLQNLQNLPFSQLQMPKPQISYKIMPIGSFDEMKAIPTDFNGSVLVGIDKASQAIYTKTLDMNTGVGKIDVYKLVTQMPPVQEKAQEPLAATPVVDYNSLVDRIELLEKKILPQKTEVVKK